MILDTADDTVVNIVGDTVVDILIVGDTVDDTVVDILIVGDTVVDKTGDTAVIVVAR